jgi:hypothetical protein
VTKPIEEAITKNENKYKNILNHHGNVIDIDFDSSVLKLFLLKLDSFNEFLMSFSTFFDFDRKLLVRLKS